MFSKDLQLLWPSSAGRGIVPYCGEALQGRIQPTHGTQTAHVPFLADERSLLRVSKKTSPLFSPAPRPCGGGPLLRLAPRVKSNVPRHDALKRLLKAAAARRSARCLVTQRLLLGVVSKQGRIDRAEEEAEREVNTRGGPAKPATLSATCSVTWAPRFFCIRIYCCTSFRLSQVKSDPRNPDGGASRGLNVTPLHVVTHASRRERLLVLNSDVRRRGAC